MPSSKYPNQIDSSSELPIVRNNIDEIGSEAINSLRSSIIQIEKTLGINPQGSVGNSVSTRISQSLDQSGNLLRDALERANVIFGQITNDNIASNAAIDESKLRLAIPTSVLQSEVSELTRLINTMISQIRELSALYSSHTSPFASNRHPSSSISFPATTETSSVAFNGNDTTSNLESVIQNIIRSHLNFFGAATSDNKAHDSSTIFYDNLSRPDIISGNDVKTAIDDLASSSDKLLIDYKNLNNSNGLVKKANITGATAGLGIIIAENVDVTINKNISSSRITQINFTTPIDTPSFIISKGDGISLVINSESFEFQIYDIVYNSITDTLIDSVLIFGSFSEDIETTATIYYKQKNYYKPGALSISPIYNTALTSSDSILILNPSSPIAISDGIKIGEITDSNRYISIKINNDAENKIDLYNTDFINIDTIVESFNREFCALLIPLSAYRIELENGGSEIAIASNIGSSTSYKINFTISRSTDDCIDSLGFAHLEDKEISGNTGVFYEINGKKYFELNKKLHTTELAFTSGLSVINYTGGDAFDFNDYNIKIGDFINILGDGYNLFLKITNILPTQLYISTDQLPTGFLSSSSDGLEYVIYDNVINFSSFEFEEVSADFGSTIFEIFLDKENKLLYNPVLEFQTPVVGNDSVLDLINFENPGGLTTATINFSISDDDYPQLYFDENNIVKIVGNMTDVIIRSTTTGLTCRFFIPDISKLKTYISSNPYCNIFFFSNANRLANLVLGQILYKNFSSNFGGGDGAFRKINDVSSGTISVDNISKDFIHKEIDVKIDDLRASGVINGLEIYNHSATQDGYADGYLTFSVYAGVCYVNGVRFFIKRTENIITNILMPSDSDKVYIGVDRFGNIIYESCDSNCNYPWSEEDVCLLGSIEYSGTTQFIDMRLFIDKVDLKILNSITVSPQRGLGHFTDLVKAIKYAKRFSQIFPDAGTPEIHLKSGNHVVIVDITTDLLGSAFFLYVFQKTANNYQKQFFDAHIQNGVFLDFPVKFTGEGSSTKLFISTRVTDNTGVAKMYSGHVIIPGNGFNPDGTRSNLYHSRISSGKLEISNLEIKHIKDIPNYNLETVSSGSTGILSIIDSQNELLDGATGYADVFEIEISNIFCDQLFVVEVSTTTEKCGNFTIKNNKIGDYIFFNPLESEERLFNISILNNTTYSSSGIITNINFNDLTVMLPDRKIIFLNNRNAYSNSTQNIDRVNKDLVIPGSITIGDDFTFLTEKTLEKTIWLYQHIVGIETYIGSSFPIFPSVPYELDAGRAFTVNVTERDSTSDVANMLNLEFIENISSSGTGRSIPIVKVRQGASFTVPLDLSESQRLKKIIIYPGFEPTIPDSTDYLQANIYKVSHRSTIASGTDWTEPVLVASSDNLQIRGSNRTFLWELDLLAETTTQYFYILELNNISSVDVYYSKVLLKFMSTKLFELIGLS